MAEKKGKKLNPTQQKYQKLVQETNPAPKRIQNAGLAFLTGGAVCLLGQILVSFYAAILKISLEKANNPAVATMIFLGALFTGLGWFDKLARFAGAGLAVPVTGFANSIVSAALEFKQEGYVQGIGSKMFMLAGSVITYGVVTAFVVGLIFALFHGKR
jgi:stage V sporulation protein AC